MCPDAGWWCSLNTTCGFLLSDLYRQPGTLFPRVTWLTLTLYSDLYSNVNSLGKPVMTPQLKTVTLHPSYSLLHSNTLTLRYILIGLLVPSMSSLIGHRLHETELCLIYCFIPSTINSAWHLTKKAFSQYFLNGYLNSRHNYYSCFTVDNTKDLRGYVIGTKIS